VKRTLRGVATLVLAVGAMAAQPPQIRDPVLLLISFDGWRWDYTGRAEAPHVNEIARRGVRAERLIPSFPTLTFPNHYTIVTGLRPARHGIVGNTMVDPTYPERFTMSSETAKDARWWNGEPLWVTAERQGRRSATMFWPGSEAAVGGVRPTYWTPYDETVPNSDRVAQVLAWLDRPAGERPVFVSLYFEEVDTTGHHFGPDSPEVMGAVARLDQALGELVEGVRRLGLEDRTHYVLVSDHGMATVSDTRVVFLDEFVDPAAVDLVHSGPLLMLAPRSGPARALHAAIDGRHAAFDVYLRETIPERLRYRDNPRIAPLVGLVDEGWTVTTRARHETRQRAGPDGTGGEHGYDPALPSMGALFVAAGPAVRSGLVARPFENIHLYEFMCAILGLTPAENDGSADVTRPLLR
jgi:predicted AlkP superfamily pyrophosphatase or phosphodiesterase